MKKRRAIGQSFMKGTLVLTSSIFIVKILGILFRIFVTGMIGPTGAAYFTVAYEIYNPLFELATAGFPIAISRMISENMAMGHYRDVRKIHNISIPIFLTTGFIGLCLMILGAFVVPKLPFVNVPGAIYSVLALSPTILFACLMSIYRGYHQGLRNMVPTAISEIIEAGCKFILGYSISYSIITYGVWEYSQNGTFLGYHCEDREAALRAIMPFASAGAILGISIGAFCGFLFLFINHKRRGDGITEQELENSPQARPKAYLIRVLIKTALPIGIGAIILNVAGLIDTSLILNRIQHIMEVTPGELLDYYGSAIKPDILRGKDGVHGYLLGCYSYTLPLMMLVPAITQTFGVVSLPSVTNAYTKKDPKKLKHSIESVMKLTMMVTIPAGLALAILGPHLLKIIYPNRVDAVNIASHIIPILGIATIFMASVTPFCSMLQAVGRVDLPVKIISFGLLIKIVVNYLLVGIPKVNIQGAGMGTLIGYLFSLVASSYNLFKETRIVPNIKDTILKPLVAGVVCAVELFFISKILIDLFPLLISIIISSIIYLCTYVLALSLLGSLKSSELKNLIKSKKIIKALEKCRFLR